jgi:nucleoside-diphosphate-sugar epimerase
VTSAAAATAPRAFVAGATGYTGQQVVRILGERRVDTIAHVRPDSPTVETWREKFSTATGDPSRRAAMLDTTPWKEAAMTSALTTIRPTVVFSLLGTTRARGKRARAQGTAENYETVDYGLSALLLRSAAEVGRTTGIGPRFVYLSALGASPSSPASYLAVRGRLEGEIRGSGLSYVIARPAFISGADRADNRFLERFSSIVIDGGLSIAGALGAGGFRDRYASLTGSELARALVRLALDETASVVADARELRRVAAG